MTLAHACCDQGRIDLTWSPNMQFVGETSLRRVHVSVHVHAPSRILDGRSERLAPTEKIGASGGDQHTCEHAGARRSGLFSPGPVAAANPTKFDDDRRGGFSGTRDGFVSSSLFSPYALPHLSIGRFPPSGTRLKVKLCPPEPS